MIIRPVLFPQEQSDGLYNIKIYLYKDGKKTYIKTPHRILKDEWNKKTWVKKTRSNFEYINSDLRSRINDIELSFLKNQNEGINAILKNKVTKAVTLSEYLKKHLDELSAVGQINRKTGQPYASGTKRGKKVLIKRLSRFFEDTNCVYDFDSIDFDFYEKYTIYLRHSINEESGYKENTIGRTIRELKCFMRKARKAGLHNNNQFEEFPAKRYDVDNIYLTEEEIERFMNVDLGDKKDYIYERDRFYVAYNFFLRYTDSISIDKSNIKHIDNKYFLDLMPSKTKDKVIVPFKPRTLEILKKYNYKLSQSNNSDSNAILKKIGKMAKINEDTTITEIVKGVIIKKQYEKYELITTHTARRSAATNYYLSMVENGSLDMKSLMLLGGWKSAASAENYIKIGKQQNANRALAQPFFQR